ncbi:MAG: base-flipping protein [Bacteroidota bacterium]|jgi:methylated-DNA-protein-cysteine methyltransferase related protein
MKADLNFFESVYAVVRQIPKGRVTSYGAIANYLSVKQASRMVGWAMNASHELLDVPAHRVVNRNGQLTGKHHFPGVNLMEEMLQSEGHQIINDQIVNFKNVFWDPTQELLS